MSLYTHYRPHDWDSVMGQDYLTTILRNSLKTDRVGHAYLFHGSRGTGKTTSARILAEWVNCANLQNGNPCHECANCRAFDGGTMLDCIEIDGASNNGVENVRELIERARFEPNQGKYKVYIIDEVHMLSTGAFNALLKTLEEPPPHVKFILATTEIEKVPETIRSRSLRFDFRKITQDDIIEYLTKIAKIEWIHVEDEAYRIIAKAARGGMRDAVTLFEQNIVDKEVRTEHLRHTLALIDESLIDGIIEDLRARKSEKIIEILETLRTGHIDARGLLEQLLYRLRDLLFEHISDPLFYDYQEVLTLIMEGHSKLRVIPDGMMLVEVTFLKIVKRKDAWMVSRESKIDIEKSTMNAIDSKKGKQNITSSTIPDSPKHETNQPVSPATSQSKTQETSAISWEEVETSSLPKYPLPLPVEVGKPPLWTSNSELPTPELPTSTIFSFPLIISHFRQANPALMTDLKSARFQVDGQILIFIFTKSWNHGRVNTPKVKNLITEALSTLFSGDWRVECKLEEWNHGNIGADEVF